MVSLAYGRGVLVMLCRSMGGDKLGRGVAALRRCRSRIGQLYDIVKRSCPRLKWSNGLEHTRELVAEGRRMQ